LNLSSLASGAIKDIEQIDLVAGSLNNSLTVTQQTLLDLSPTSNRLTVLGGVGDTVTATGFATSGSIIENGINYTAYNNGAATLWVQQGVTVAGAASQSSGYVLTGFDGDQTLIVGDTSFLRVDGGAGTDTLRLAGTAGFGLNLSSLASGAIKDIEQIDLVAGSLNNTLTVTQQTLLDLSTTSNRLTVLGDSGDTVNATGFVTGSSQIENGIRFNIYSNGAATLWVQQGVKIVGASAPTAPSGLDLITADDTGPSSTDNLTNKQSVTITGTAEVGSTVELFDGTTSRGTKTVSATGAFSFTVTLDAGAHSITAKATDAAGKVSAASAALTVTVDTTAPNTPVINVVSGNDKVNVTEAASGITISGTAEANATVTLRWGSTTERTLSADNNGNWSTIYYSAALPTVATSAITATQTDAAGNTSGQASRPVEIDLTPVITGMSNDYGTLGDFTTDRNTVVLTGTGFPNGTIELFINGVMRGTATVDSAGLWVSPVISLAALAFNSSVTATVRAKDAAGNVSVSDASQVITKASTASTQINLGLSTAAVGFFVEGAITQDRVSSLATGDVNGDGHKDLILSHSLIGSLSLGAVTVLYGRSDWTGVASYDLANLGNNGYVLRGTGAGDSLGSGGAGFIGDLNGDGFAELIVGAPGVDRADLGNSGAAYIIWGSNGSSPMGTLEGNRYIKDVSTITPTEGFVFRGLTASEIMGNATLGISSRPGAKSDFNGDGLADFFISAIGYDNGGNNHGGVIVVFGRADRAYGSVNVTTGQQEMTVADLTADKGFIIVGGVQNDPVGRTIASAGDVNGDGVTDLLIGGQDVDRGSFGTAGAAYVIYGKKTPDGQQTWSGLVNDPLMAGRKILDLGALKTEDGFMIWGEAANAEFGQSVEGLGDINGDGFGDIIVGARNSTVGGVSNAGKAYVILGSASGQATAAVSPAGRQILDVSAMISSQGFIIQGAATVNAVLGASVGAAGDVNGDGLADVMVASPGAAFIIYGKNNGEGWGQTVGTQSILDLTNFGSSDGFVVSGRGGGDNLGVDTAPGDLNNDGVDDLFIYLNESDSLSRYNNGSGAFVYGTRGAGGLTLTGASGGDTLNGGGLADTINGLGGLDRLSGFDGNDTLIVGNAGFVRVDGGAGTDTLRMAGTSGFNLNLASLASGAVKDIEQIDLVAGSLNNTLTVTRVSLLDLSSTSDLLKVFGGVGDTVNATGFVAGGSIIENGINFSAYTSGMATLWVQQGVSVSDATSQSSGYVLTGLAGNETLIVGNTNFLRVDGGAGNDTLRLAGTTGLSLDLSTLASGAIKDIEQIDLVAGSLNNTLTVTQQTLLGLSTTSNRLTVLGDSGDRVNAAGFTAGSNQIVNGITYKTYSSGLAELWVPNGVVVETGVSNFAPAISWTDQSDLAGIVSPPESSFAPAVSWADQAVLAV
ncbi:MAG: beta strand repeat-containing protein, partial [Sphingomonadaceae bacterium]